MNSRKFDSKKALLAYAEQNGLACLSESFTKWQGLLSPKDYVLVEVRMNNTMQPAMLLPKATLKAAWEADPLRRALLGTAIT
jgi:hypothetical protein